MVSDPWGSLPSRSGTQEDRPDLQFEDNFTSEARESNESNYVALEDSSSYLERLQKKLDKIRGNADTSSSRSLLAGLKSARQCQHHHFLSTTNKENNPSHNEEKPPSGGDSVPLAADLPHARGHILTERQRHVDSLLLRLAPDRVALAPDELIYLLSADILGGVNDLPAASDGAVAPSQTDREEGLPRSHLDASEREASVGDTQHDNNSNGIPFEVDFEAANFGREENV